MKKILIKFERFDDIDYHVVAYKIFTEDSWNSLMNNLDQYNNPQGIKIYFGHNDFVEFRSGKEFLEYCDEEYKVTESDIKVLEKIGLNLDSHQIFVSIIEIVGDR